MPEEVKEVTSKRYLLKIHYRTMLMDKVTGYMQQIMPDWKKSDRRLVLTETLDISGSRPLTAAEIANLKSTIAREEGVEIEGIEIEEEH